MKALYQFVLIACLIASNLFSQGKSDNDIEEISQEEWDNIVDYVNAEVTGFSMEKYKNTRKRIEPAEEIDLDKFNKLLESNSREEPIPFEEIKNNTELNWNKTFGNISKPIDSLKRYSLKMLDSLFYKIEHLESFKNLELIESPEYAYLKKEFFPKEQSEKIVQNIEKKEPERPVVSIVKRTAKRSSYNYWMIPSLLFLISTITLFVMWRKERIKHNDLKTSKDNANTKREIELSSLHNQIDRLKLRNNKLESNQKPFVEKQSKPIQASTVIIDEPKAPEVELTPVEKPKVPQILYAGKPTTDGKFIPVSSSPLYGQTIYKLYVQEDGLSADFEIELVDQFITREVTNAPDEYLYRVCNQENSNKEFSREIITTKRGLAVLINDEWLVKEENKATIKFQ